MEEKKEPPKRQETKKDDRKNKKTQPPEEVKELTPEEIKQQKLEALKEETRSQIEQLTQREEKLQEKLALLKTTRSNFQSLPTEIDLQDHTGNRKFLKTKAEEAASSVLNTKSNYTLVAVNEADVIPFEVDGFCVRSIEEDATAQDETDVKGKGKKAPPKKK